MVGTLLWNNQVQHNHSDQTIFQYFQAAVRNAVMATTFLDGFDCYLANKVLCAYTSYYMSAEMGLMEAQMDLVSMLERNWGNILEKLLAENVTSLADQNVRSDFLWRNLRAAHFKRHFNSEFSLNSLLIKMSLLSRNHTEAVENYRVLCDKRSSEGCYSLGWAFLHGVGVEQNVTEARRLFAELVLNEKGDYVGMIVGLLMWIRSWIMTLINW
jgi:TPR repeat protein